MKMTRLSAGALLIAALLVVLQCPGPAGSICACPDGCAGALLRPSRAQSSAAYFPNYPAVTSCARAAWPQIVTATSWTDAQTN